MGLYSWILVAAVILDLFATIEIGENGTYGKKEKFRLLLMIWLIPFVGFLIYFMSERRKRGWNNSDRDGYVGTDTSADDFPSYESGGHHHDHFGGFDDAGHD